MNFGLNFPQIVKLELVRSHDTTIFLSKSSFCSDERVVLRPPRPIARITTPVHRQVQPVAICLLPTKVVLKVEDREICCVVAGLTFIHS